MSSLFPSWSSCFFLSFPFNSTCQMCLGPKPNPTVLRPTTDRRLVAVEEYLIFGVAVAAVVVATDTAAMISLPPPSLSLSFYISSGFQLFPIPKFERIVSACFIYLRIARLCLLFLYLLLPTHIFIDVTYVRLTNWSKSISCWNLPACLPVLPQSIALHCKQSRRWRRPPPCLKLRCIWNFGVSWAFLIIIITHAPSSSGGQLLVLARSLARLMKEMNHTKLLSFHCHRAYLQVSLVLPFLRCF